MDSWQSAYNIFASKNGLAVKTLFAVLERQLKHSGNLTLTLDNYNACKAANIRSYFVALIRIGFKPFIKDMSFMLIRSDLMRFSLSSAKTSAKRLGAVHPQFKKKSSNESKMYYPLEDLNATASLIVQHWRKNVKYVCLMRDKKIPVRPIFYEQFLQNKMAFTSNMYEAFTGTSQPPEIPPGYTALETKKVRRVHSSDISTFVENDYEVFQHFFMSDYPTFNSVKDIECGKRKKKCLFNG